MRRYLRDPTFSRFDTIPECDGHTHTHTQTDTLRRHIPCLARRRTVKTLSADSDKPPSAWKSALVMPIPKVSSVKSFTDLRPISVSPILSRLVEKIIVQKYIIPALPVDTISDQFVYRPTWSTTAALVSLTHIVAQKLESCTHVRCLLIDYTKAFDTINHSILFRKFLTLPIPSEINVGY